MRNDSRLGGATSIRSLFFALSVFLVLSLTIYTSYTVMGLQYEVARLKQEISLKSRKLDSKNSRTIDLHGTRSISQEDSSVNASLEGTAMEGGSPLSSHSLSSSDSTFSGDNLPNHTTPKVLLFIIVRSKDSNKNYRDAARATWLSKEALGEDATYRFFVDKVTRKPAIFICSLCTPYIPTTILLTDFPPLDPLKSSLMTAARPSPLSSTTWCSPTSRGSTETSRPLTG
jgi:hypothetical protein